ncbi:unnamed protein product [Acanthoscelides obtectus]|uniref:SCP domain-containing protein n=1 Tax=Acanthoscelides obtectus TaxID=200917 RepID=A0A9P0P1J5_ACAOB|nr:unnamed protein product [Acanthoscelides obtectus]CAK1648115.1 hypothetical protein AOBTE_LOCUS15546 [Acanthoscelides obtectus]
MKTPMRCLCLCIPLLLLLNVNSINGNCHAQWPTCGTEENVVCKTKYGKPVPHCKIIRATPEFRETIVDSHNFYRNHVATGNETRGAFRPIADMRTISYDSYLEFTAQCQASRCNYDHDADCYATKNFTDVGQNLNGRVIEEDTNFTFSSVEETRSMVSQWYNMMICNYGPRGLRVTKPIGKFGRPCSRCPEKPEKLSCNEVYEGLCGEVDKSHYNLTISRAAQVVDNNMCSWLTKMCFATSFSLNIWFSDLTNWIS